MHNTLPLLEVTDFPPITRQATQTLQVNLGYRCNQRCLHCHVNAGPNRTEMMAADDVNLVLEVLEKNRIRQLDLTGGAPEMHPQFRHLVASARNHGIHVIDRCNLTILNEPGYLDLADFLADHKVQIVASMPCYSEKNVDQQRGKGVFARSIDGLKALNALGYGQPNSELELILVYNPNGAFLPPNQQQLEADYRQRLNDDFGIQFTQLFALANMPINRFGSTLVSKGEFDSYMSLLRNNFSTANLDKVMCRSLISVDWRGYLYDCDFNQQLGLPLGESSGNALASSKSRHLRDLLRDHVEGLSVQVADHCYGCTAGQGSSCGGAL